MPNVITEMCFLSKMSGCHLCSPEDSSFNFIKRSSVFRLERSERIKYFFALGEKHINCSSGQKKGIFLFFIFFLELGLECKRRFCIDVSTRKKLFGSSRNILLAIRFPSFMLGDQVSFWSPLDVDYILLTRTRGARN